MQIVRVTFRIVEVASTRSMLSTRRVPFHGLVPPFFQLLSAARKLPLVVDSENSSRLMRVATRNAEFTKKDFDAIKWVFDVAQQKRLNELEPFSLFDFPFFSFNCCKKKRERNFAADAQKTRGEDSVWFNSVSLGVSEMLALTAISEQMWMNFPSRTDKPRWVVLCVHVMIKSTGNELIRIGVCRYLLDYWRCRWRDWAEAAAAESAKHWTGSGGSPPARPSTRRALAVWLRCCSRHAMTPLAFLTCCGRNASRLLFRFSFRPF